MPSARTTIFGSALKSRLGVNGIQYSSSETWRGCAWSRRVSSAWSIEISLLGREARACIAPPHDSVLVIPTGRRGQSQFVLHAWARRRLPIENAAARIEG